jgi:hypothetical protein
MYINTESINLINETKKQIKQLENENGLLKQKLINELKTNMEQQTRLKLQNDLLRKELLKIKQHCAMLELQNNVL